MKENIKKQMRLQVIAAMAIAAMIIIASDVTNEFGCWMKGAAVMLGAAAYVMFRKWQKADKLPRLEDL